MKEAESMTDLEIRWLKLGVSQILQKEWNYLGQNQRVGVSKRPEHYQWSLFPST